MRLQHFSLFWSGQSYFMRDAVARAVGAWDAAMPGYGDVLGMYAFGLEECGDYAAAEPKGRRAVELCKDDLWAVHAVAHVLEMQGRLEEGTSFLAQPYGTWDDRNPFRQHLWWHTALFPLELGQYDRVLELYDRAVRAELTDFYLDIQNAASMLFRLEWCGVDVGQRWSELADIAERRIDDHVMAFTDLHLMLALCRDGRLPKAEELIASFRAFAQTPENSTAATMEPAAIPIAEAMLAYARGDYGAAVDRLIASRYAGPWSARATRSATCSRCCSSPRRKNPAGPRSPALCSPNAWSSSRTASRAGCITETRWTSSAIKPPSRRASARPVKPRQRGRGGVELRRGAPRKMPWRYFRHR